MLLAIEGFATGYGQSRICEDVDLQVDDGELVCLLGRNGVGKTTLMRGIMGLLPQTKGRIRFDGQDITALPEFKRARLGIGYVPQGRLVFGRLTVAENLRSGTIIGGTRLANGYASDVLDYFPILRERLNQKAGTMSGGEQQMLAIARALAGKPRLLLLDEPSEGIQPSIVQDIRDILQADQPGPQTGHAAGRAEPEVRLGAGTARLRHREGADRRRRADGRAGQRRGGARAPHLQPGERA